MRKLIGLLGGASLVLAVALPATPAHAGGGDITNFSVKNCIAERIFVCSFDKTDSLMTIPYDAKGIKSFEKKEFGCASLDKCKVIIGVSKKKSERTLSSGMQAGLATGAVSGAVIAGSSVALYSTIAVVMEGAAATVIAGTGLIAGAIIAVGAGGAVAALEISDGWKDGEVCNQVRKAAQKAGMKPKSFMKNGKAYQVIEQYATDKDGRLYLNADGTAVIAYAVDKARGSCPAPLATQLVKD